jgi:hypothetical protein
VEQAGGDTWNLTVDLAVAGRGITRPGVRSAPESSAPLGSSWRRRPAGAGRCPASAASRRTRRRGR